MPIVRKVELSLWAANAAPIFGHASDKAKIKAAHEHPLSRQFDAGRRSMVLHQHKVRLMNHRRLHGLRALCLMPFMNLHVRRLRPQAQSALADQCRKLTPSVQKPEAEFELDRGPMRPSPHLWHGHANGIWNQQVRSGRSAGNHRHLDASEPGTSNRAQKQKPRRTAAGFCKTRSSAVRSPFSNPWQRGRRLSCSP